MISSGSSADLFEDEASLAPRTDPIAPGAVVLRQFVGADDDALLAQISYVQAEAPWRRMVTPGGLSMSVAMTNCGTVGWVSDRSGYRYDPIDPASGRSWPAMPEAFVSLARRAASAAGFESFEPDACLVNRYEPGTRLSLHQDRDERDFSAPIVSVSLGLPVIFLFGGAVRAERARRIPLFHGDVVVWGGAARLAFHGVAPLKEGHHPKLGRQRVNLTFRKAL